MTISVENLTFAYSEKEAPALKNVNLSLPPASRALLLGPNDAGKTTLLRVLSGVHPTDPEIVQLGGQHPYYTPHFNQEITWIESYFPLFLDVEVAELLEGPGGRRDSRRLHQLLDLLEIKPNWKMSRVSEGQRRRVQLALALSNPSSYIFLDEVTSHLDVVVRSNLLQWISRLENTNIIYATHIMDGLEDPDWPTHLLLLRNGRLEKNIAWEDRQTIFDQFQAKDLASFSSRWMKTAPSAGAHSYSLHP